MSEELSGMPALSFGQKAVGLTFNPSNDPTVQKLKELFAATIDCIWNERGQIQHAPSEKDALYKEAQRYAQIAQMLAVKAATWKD